jgi:hypothetical protein
MAIRKVHAAPHGQRGGRRRSGQVFQTVSCRAAPTLADGGGRNRRLRPPQAHDKGTFRAPGLPLGRPRRLSS